MRNVRNLFFLSIAFFILSLEASAQTDLSPHKVQFVTVEQGVQLEVLDWGGSGGPLIFLAGAGDTAHCFDGFAPQFIAFIMSTGSHGEDQAHPANPRRPMAIIRRII